MNDLEKLVKLIRYYILTSTTAAGSGHTTSALSAVELMTTLFFKYFRYDLNNPDNPVNDRFILSKGHASPILYSLYAAAGAISEAELLTLRKFDCELEGHPTPRFRYAEVATGSLGQGLSVGLGLALAIRQRYSSSEPKASREDTNIKESSRLHSNNNKPNVFVLLGDGEMAEGQVWEAINLASHYKLNNLIAILDVNRLGQSQQTILGHDVQEYARRVASFGWRVYIVENGHDLEEVDQAFHLTLSSAGPAPRFSPKSTTREPLFGDPQRVSPAVTSSEAPALIIAKTIKGKGVSFLEDKNGFHGIPLKTDELEKALKELGEFDRNARGVIKKPDINVIPAQAGISVENSRSNTRFPIKSGMTNKLFSINYKKGDGVATRRAFGEAVVKLGELYPELVVLDGDVQNSTYTELFAKKYPERFFQMYIAEQNLVSTAVGLARMNLRPVVSTFGSFLTRAFDQIRMAALSSANIIFNGSHAGVSIGEDGPSQMGLEDLAMFRSILNSIVLYPSDAVAMEKLMQKAYSQKGIVYIRTARPKTPVIYDNDEEFHIGGSKTHSSSSEAQRSREVMSFPRKRESIQKDPRSESGMTLDGNSRLSASGGTSSNNKKVTVVAAGITVIEALKAQEQLAKEGIEVDVVDCYSVKPIDKETLVKAARETGLIITVEDHYAVGGLGDAVLEALAEEKNVRVIKLAVTKTPRSGKPEELLDYEGISAKGIIMQIKRYIS